MYQFHKLESMFSVDYLVNASSYHLTREFTGMSETHDFWELVYCDKGEAVVEAGGDKFLLKAGEMVFHCPGERHDVYSHEDRNADIIILAFTCNSPIMSEFNKKTLFLGPREKACLTSIVEEAASSYEYFDNDPPYVQLIKKESCPFCSEQIIKDQLQMLLIYIARKERYTDTVIRELSSNNMRQHEYLVEEAKKYIKDHLNEKLTLEKVSNALGISVSLLKHIFHEHSSESVISYVTRLRIAEAKRMIRTHNLNFTQIAEALGYDNIHYFSSQFKKQTGMTPTEYSRSVHS